MSSSAQQRKQKIPRGSCLQGVAVNPRGTEGVQSYAPARKGENTCGHDDSLMEQVVERSNMLRALHRVEENKGACGVDGLEVKNLRPYLKEHWLNIREHLLGDTYHPSPVRRVEIPKPDGGARMLGIPTVIDRLIQQALLQRLTPLFDPGFSPCSYGFRPGCRAHDAVRKAQEYVREGRRYVVDLDLEKFFDRVNHDILMSRVARKVKDKRVLRLIRRYLSAGIMANGCCMERYEGTPQGGPLSPLLANVLLDDLDKELERRGAKFVRYADDENIYVKSLRAGRRVFESVVRFVEERLKLKVNREKSAVDRPWRRKFLGFSFTIEKASRIRVASKSAERFKTRVKEITRRHWGTSMAQRLRRLNEHLRGWFGYFKLTETPSVLHDLDEWVRRRLRACLLEQWKRPKTKRRNLVNLGLPEEWARLISGSRKGTWRLSKTPQTQKALGLAYWRTQGLFSLTENYRLYCQSL